MSLPLSEFIKFYPLRSKNLSWLFGAGSSVAAGVPSAYDLTWDFKKRIYCAEQSYPLHLFNNLTDRGIREQIQNYFDSQESCPPLDDSAEYSYYFERAFPSLRDRSEYIAAQTSGMQLTYGHKVLGILLKNRFLDTIFTTNFDKAFENVAKTEFNKLEDWFAVDLDNTESGMRFFQSGKRPLIVKLHGDYFSDKLKNTTHELQEQDKKLRNILSLTLATNGLCVMGYSGRDKSVMDIIHESLNNESSLPNGLFWFHRTGGSPLPEVVDLIEKAKENGKQAEIIEIDTFDSAWGDILKGFNNIPVEDLNNLHQHYYKTGNQPLQSKGKYYPIIRLNALPLLEYPATARLYKCNAGNTKEVQESINNVGSSIIATRKRSGVVGFGSDGEFSLSFKEYEFYGNDLYHITTKDLLHDDSSVKYLLCTALVKALAGLGPFRYTKKRGKLFLFPNPKQLDSSYFTPLKSVFPQLSGKIPNTSLVFIVALEINVLYSLSTPLITLNPTIIASKTSEKSEGRLVAPFIKEQMARWYNQKYDQILNCWLDTLFGQDRELVISAYASDIIGVNAKFKISRTTAYTKLY